MKPNCSLPILPVPANFPYPEPAQSSQYPQSDTLAAAIIKPALYRLLTFQVPNLNSLFQCLVHTKVSVQARIFVC
jgi:hypothetical protein